MTTNYIARLLQRRVGDDVWEAVIDARFPARIFGANHTGSFFCLFAVPWLRKTVTLACR